MGLPIVELTPPIQSRNSIRMRSFVQVLEPTLVCGSLGWMTLQGFYNKQYLQTSQSSAFASAISCYARHLAARSRDQRIEPIRSHPCFPLAWIRCCRPFRWASLPIKIMSLNCHRGLEESFRPDTVKMQACELQVNLFGVSNFTPRRQRDLTTANTSSSSSERPFVAH